VVVNVGCVGSETGNEGGTANGAGIMGRTTFGLATAGAADFFTATAFVLVLDFVFLGAAFTAFLAALTALRLFLGRVRTFAFAGRAFLFATLFLAAVRLALDTGRFLDLLFFAMITLLLEIVGTRCESSPEKVCCHLCMRLESVT
jgi:hypothetical protein